MTEPSAEKLADALDAEGFYQIADRARRDEFHDYRSPHDFPVTVLVRELRACGRRGREFAARVEAGAFDATREELQAYMQSERGQRDMKDLLS